MTQPKFKPGDRVRDLMDDDEATVFAVKRNEIQVEWDGHDGPSPQWWLADDFELIPPELDPTAGEGEV